jgi:hypothetical protein
VILFRLEKLRFDYYTLMKRKTSPREVRSGRPDSSEVLQTVFRILNELSIAHGAVGLTAIARVLGEQKPRVYRHLSTLKALGVALQDGRSGGYRFCAIGAAQ